MSDSAGVLPWLVIRHDESGNRYRVGHFATRTEAERVADRLDLDGDKKLYTGDKKLYTVERAVRRESPA
jgi:hypothetical protein